MRAEVTREEFDARRYPVRVVDLWSGWTNPVDNTQSHSFTTITTDPNFLLEQYHNQMPVILKPSE